MEIQDEAEDLESKPLKEVFVMDKHAVIAIILFAIDVGLICGAIAFVAVAGIPCEHHEDEVKVNVEVEIEEDDDHHDEEPHHRLFGIGAMNGDLTRMSRLGGPLRRFGRSSSKFNRFQSNDKFLKNTFDEFQIEGIQQQSTDEAEDSDQNVENINNYEEIDEYDPYKRFGNDFSYYNRYYDKYLKDYHDPQFDGYYYNNYDDKNYKNHFAIDYGNDDNDFKPRVPAALPSENSTGDAQGGDLYYNRYEKQDNPPANPSSYVPAGLPWPDTYYRDENSDDRSHWPEFLPGDDNVIDWYTTMTAWKAVVSTTLSVPRTTTENPWPTTTKTPSHSKNVERSSPAKYYAGKAPASGSPHGTDTTLRATDLFPNMAFECGVQEIKPTKVNETIIVGGAEAIPHSWPWAVSILQKQHKAYLPHWFTKCGGTIVTPRHVITAWHCWDNVFSKEKFLVMHTVMVGQHNKSSSLGKRYLLGDVRIHPQASEDFTLIYDILLLSLKRVIIFSSKIQPACLPKVDQELTPGKLCWTYGWGGKGVEQDLPSSAVLHQVNVTVATFEECKKVFPPDAAFITKDILVCAGTENKEDACQEDSGGPFTCLEEEKWVLYGTTSWGEGCVEGALDTYAAISYSMNWLCCFFNRIPGCVNVACDAEKYKFP